MNKQAAHLMKLDRKRKTSSAIDMLLRTGLIRYNNKVYYDPKTNSYNIMGLLIHICGWNPEVTKEGILSFCGREFDAIHPWKVIEKVFQLPKNVYLDVEEMEKNGNTLDEILSYLERQDY